MKVFIKNKLISLRGSSEVLNENMEPIFKVKGKLISFTKKKFMYDMEGNLLFTIRNKYWNFFSYKVFVKNADGDLLATVKKRRWSFNLKYEILDTENEMTIDGKFFSNLSRIMKNGKPVATIKRDFSILNDAFTLEAEENDIAFYTALVIAFDNLKDDKERD